MDVGRAVRPVYAGKKVDTTSKALTAEAKRLGVEVAPLGGAIDLLVWLGPVVRLVETKSPGGGLTDSQAKLVARGCPIHFVTTAEQMGALVAGMKREANA